MEPMRTLDGLDLDSLKGEKVFVRVDFNVPLAEGIGPKTRSAIPRELAGARTVFGNGPMGVFEPPPFDDGTEAVAAAVAGPAGHTVIGGGETLAGRRLPGVEVLRRNA